jgi:hypothetical protein
MVLDGLNADQAFVGDLLSCSIMWFGQPVPGLIPERTEVRQVENTSMLFEETELSGYLQDRSPDEKGNGSLARLM